MLSSSKLLSKTVSSHACKSMTNNFVRYGSGLLSTPPVSGVDLTNPEHTSEATYGYNTEDGYFEKFRIDPSQAADPTGRTSTYLTYGAASAIGASVGRHSVHKFISYLSASADVLALASLEVDVGAIPEGECITVKWRGKPVFLRHRTEKEIQAAKDDDKAVLRDPQSDAERIQNPKYAIMLGICTHLGCVPVTGAGDYGGWFCPCHGSHYDLSGRIRKGPAPLNLEIPTYKFLDESKITLG